MSLDKQDEFIVKFYYKFFLQEIIKKINKIVAFILVFAIVITNTNIVFANNVSVSNLQLESVSIREEEKLLKDIYNGLGTEAKQLFLEEIKGDLELQKLHKEFVDKNY